MTMYMRSSLTGGGSDALDGIDGAILTSADRAIVVTTSNYYVYYLNPTSGASESSPNVIAPDINAVDKRWILVSAYS